ncbi:beta-N-acetylhexosaminidase [Actinoplanes sp. SE50]|uniref:beta-N-acetylhexosaminidase n=1 Tax=unclassified Actinoplanes TaxID=2626549 RepID=UPI00023EC4BE|nr:MULTISPECIES: beta-N-acetylhexosaminidase [unclassified Actinoplanes]AEV85862.1 beta-hexosaminidase [Actinoplanes sp. SE50/110]ATO84258.1 beta-N-acetylhexosaminidase [Actinoplanes sp. SE50]SLM01668.1 beta-N-acetylhexosaminidase [Actinoplanes sp. SE50/110]
MVRRTLVSMLLAVASSVAGVAPPAAASPPTPGNAYATIVPAPVSAQAGRGAFRIDRHTTITAAGPGAAGVADYLGELLGLPVVRSVRAGAIVLTVGGGGAPESYRLGVDRRGVRIAAPDAHGLFNGVQTLRQLLPTRGPLSVPAGRVADRPRFGQRGAMLDVARHFFTVEQVERYLDQLAAYKVNTFHFHLTDDQGWRIEIRSWPRLATYGGSTAVDGDPGGYYTQAQYREIVAYAQRRFITVVPEIDMPGHVNAALASYAELNCDGVAPPLYTGTDVGFSSLCVGKEITYRFLDDVIGELAAITPGRYLHIGGDEADSTPAADYATFMRRAQAIVARHGKAASAWHQIVAAGPRPSTVAQYWDTTPDNPAVAAAANAGTGIVLSPANLAYLDMKYTPQTPLGQDWAGLIEVRDAYGWDPGAYLTGVPAAAVRGVEAPLWTETLRTSNDLEYMAFPRLPAIAELGWSPAATHDWDVFRLRLAAQAPRWRAAGLNFYPSPQVPWVA